MDQAVTRAAGATPSTTTPAAAARRSWAILLTSANHGVVGPLGSTFPHAGEKHERVVVVEVPAAAGAPSDEVNLVLRTAPEAEASAGTVLTDERIDELWKVSTVKSLDQAKPVHKVFAHAIEREVVAQAGQVAVPEGWKLVPTHPDQFMINAFITEYERPGGSESTCYRAMLAAAPSAPAVAQQEPAATIDTREFRELLAKAMDAAELATRTGDPHRDYKPARDALVAHIDARLGAQASTAGERQEGAK